MSGMGCGVNMPKTARVPEVGSGSGFSFETAP